MSARKSRPTGGQSHQATPDRPVRQTEVQSQPSSRRSDREFREENWGQDYGTKREVESSIHPENAHPRLASYQNPQPHVFQQQQQQREMELLSLQHEIRDKNSQILLLQTKYDKMEENFNYLLQNHKLVLKHLEDLKNQNEQERLKSVKLMRDLQNAQLENTKQRTAKAKIEELTSSVKEQKKVIDSLHEALNQEDRKIELKQREEYDRKISDLNWQIREWSEQSTKQFKEEELLRSQLDGSKRRAKELEDEKMELKRMVKQFEDELHETQLQLGNSQRRIELSQKGEIERVKRISHLEQSIQDMNTTIEDMRAQLEQERANNLKRVLNVHPPRHMKESKSIPDPIQDAQPVAITPISAPAPAPAPAIIEMAPSPISSSRKEMQSPRPVSKPIERSAKPVNRDRALGEDGTLLLAIRRHGVDSVVFTKEDNTFELEVIAVVFNENFSKRFPQDHQLSFFFSFDFFEHETQCTPIVHSALSIAKWDIGFTALYHVQLSKFLLHYIQFNNLTLFMLRLKDANSYDILATCELPLKALLGFKRGEMEYRSFVKLVDASTKESIGHVSVCMKFSVPLHECSKVEAATLGRDSEKDQTIIDEMEQHSILDDELHKQKELHEEIQRPSAMDASDNDEPIT